MYGYINIDKDKLSKNEFGLYHTFLCGICLSTKKLFNNFSRFLVNYDINFFNIFFHSYLNCDAEIGMQRCVSSPFRKRTVLNSNDITDKLSIANVILMYINIKDDCIDEHRVSKKVVLASLVNSYEEAVSLAPELNNKLTNLYQTLRDNELNKCNVLDKVCDSVAELSVEVGNYLTGGNTNKYLNDLLYNIGKWVYLIDALDDLKKDMKNKQYNPLLMCLNNNNNKSAREFVSNNKDTLNFIFNTTLNRITQCFNDLNLNKYSCILRNILYNSLRTITNKIFNKYTNECKQHLTVPNKK